MNKEERYILFKQIMWDNSLSPDDIEALLQGMNEKIGRYDKNAVFIKLLESFSWFTILQLFSPEELRNLLSDDVVKRLRFKSLKTKYEFVQKRLQSLVPVAE